MMWYEILLIIGLVIFVVSVFTKAFIDHLHGKTSCGGSCASCKSNCKYSYDNLKKVYENKENA